MLALDRWRKVKESQRPKATYSAPRNETLDSSSRKLPQHTSWTKSTTCSRLKQICRNEDEEKMEFWSVAKRLSAWLWSCVEPRGAPCRKNCGPKSSWNFPIPSPPLPSFPGPPILSTKVLGSQVTELYRPVPRRTMVRKCTFDNTFIVWKHCRLEIVDQAHISWEA
jgi:hypothetical protein